MSEETCDCPADGQTCPHCGRIQGPTHRARCHAASIGPFKSSDYRWISLDEIRDKRSRRC